MVLEIHNRQRKFQLVMSDITHHCNARCIFCANCWEEPVCNCDESTFRKMLQILPFINDDEYSIFLMSCQYEPTIHPKFIEYLSLIPKEYAHKIFMTTNLMRKFTDTEIKALSLANMATINVSLESLDENINAKLMGVEHSNVIDNLYKLCAALKEKDLSKLSITTMLLKENYNSMIEFAREVRRLFAPHKHEFRYPFAFGEEDCGHNYIDKIQQHLLPTKEYADLFSQLTRVGDNIYIRDVPSETFAYFASANTTSNVLPVMKNVRRNIDVNYNVKILADGRITFGGVLHEHLGKIEDAPSLYQESLIRLQDLEAAQYGRHNHLYRRLTMNQLTDAVFCLDWIILYDSRFLRLDGWSARVINGKIACEPPLLILQTKSGEKHYYQTQVISRHNIVEYFDSSEFERSGYYCLIDLQTLPDCDYNDSFDLHFGFLAEKSDETIVLERNFARVSGLKDIDVNADVMKDFPLLQSCIQKDVAK